MSMACDDFFSSRDGRRLLASALSEVFEAVVPDSEGLPVAISERFDSVVARRQRRQVSAPSPLQVAHRLRFAEATRLALAEISDSERRAYWQRVADNSDGRYGSPRAAAFAHFYRSLG